ncbi:MAG: hypothetical protein SVU32_01805 [Candidatus Nanohaloarchaea archaeon]|nr:hypothetical protein [Candidatus Nanohaloarchaea archaeon]
MAFILAPAQHTYIETVALAVARTRDSEYLLLQKAAGKHSGHWTRRRERGRGKHRLWQLSANSRKRPGSKAKSSTEENHTTSKPTTAHSAYRRIDIQDIENYSVLGGLNALERLDREG